MQLLLKVLITTLLGSTLLTPTIEAKARYRVAKSYEDSIRIAIIWNDAQGSCSGPTSPVGLKTLEFTLSALDTTLVKNVKILKNSTSAHTSWNDITALWEGQKLPHSIVHINAGWSVDWNEKELDTIFSKAVERKIGIVSIGDDAASLATTAFGFDGVENVPAPLNDATQLDSLWVGLLRENDNKLKIFTSDSTLEYPGVNGIISNTVDSILKRIDLPFFPFGNGRCQADADKYNILYPQWITMLGYQQGYDEGKLLNGPNELNVLVAIQDTVNEKLIRRAVALSFQPQFLRDSIAAQQITYDAIMFTSLTHLLSVASKIVLHVDSDSVKAGEMVKIQAGLFDQYNNPIVDKLDLVKWEIVNKLEADSLTKKQGELTQFSSTQAWRVVTIKADFHDPETNASVSTSATIAIKPGDPHHIDAGTEASSAIRQLNSDLAPVTYNFKRTDKKVIFYAFVRDRFGNYIRVLGNDGKWTSNDTTIVKARSDSIAIYRGIITKENSGSTQVVILEGALLPDTVFLTVDSPGLVKDSYTRDINGNGYIDHIELHLDTMVSFPSPEVMRNQLSLSHESLNFDIVNILATDQKQDSVLIIEVREDTTNGLQTDWLVDIKGNIPIVINTQQDQSIIYIDQITKDGIGPVLEYALYKYSSTDQFADTMLLVLSEPIETHSHQKIEPLNLFVYYLSISNFDEIQLLEHAAELIGSGIFVDTLKLTLDPFVTRKYTLTSFKDLMQLIGSTQDAAGNYPPSKKLSRKVPVEVIGKSQITISIFPNPLNFGDDALTRLSQKVRDVFSDVIGSSSSGTLISIHSRKKLVKSGNSYARVRIYDATGNLVVHQLDVKQSKSSQDYGCLWDGCNEYRRRVGAGTYLLVFDITDIDGVKLKVTRKIGVSTKR